MRALLLIVTILLMPSGPASDGCEPSSSGAFDAAGVYIVVEDEGTALYEESNGIAGLQRMDDLRDDTCGEIVSDLSHGYLHRDPPGRS